MTNLLTDLVGNPAENPMTDQKQQELARFAGGLIKELAMQYGQTQRRADFEAWATDHYAEFSAVPNFTRSTKQPHNYTDLNVNALWWGWQAGQDTLLQRLESGND